MMSLVPGQLLHESVRKNDFTSVQHLVEEKGVDVDFICYGTTPLLLAIQLGHIDLAMWLLDKECDVFKADVNGRTAFEEAIIKDQVQVVKRLLERNVDPNMILSSGETALTYSARKRLTYMSQILVDGGTDVNLQNSRGETSLFVAAQQGHTGVMEALLKVETLSKDDPCGPDTMTPLIVSVVNEQLAAARLLLKSGCNVDAKDRHGWTALWHAVTDCSELLVRLLVTAGADITITDADGVTILDEAQRNESEEIVEILVNAQKTSEIHNPR